MVADGNFTNADELVNQDQIIRHRAEQSAAWQLIRTGMAISADPFGLKCMSFGQ